MDLMFYLQEYFRGDVVWRANGRIRQLPPIFLPRLCLPLGVHRVGQIERLHLTEVSVEIGSVRLFKTSAKAEVGKLNVAVGVQEEVIRLYVTENRFLHCLSSSSIRNICRLFEKSK